MASLFLIVVLSTLIPAICAFHHVQREYQNFTHQRPAMETDVKAFEISGIWSSYCASDTAWPCTAFCAPSNSECISSARAIVKSCGPLWSSYSSVQNGLKEPGPLWRNVTSTIGLDGGPVTTTVDVYTSFSTASTGFGRWQSNHVTPTTITPVYALGSPTSKVTITTIPEYLTPDTITVLTGPTPTCKFESLSIVTSSECGRCTLTGGTVDLYFWPPETADGSATTSPLSAGQIRSTILNGTTLFSPTVYIAIRTIYASNSCLQVGERHTGTLVAMDPEQVSTQVDIGLKQPAYRYGQLNYTDLLNPPPAWQYEMQPSCYVFGCPTIYNTRWFPTLQVPPQVRTIDPAWESCGLALEGFYDPPVALTARDAEVTASMSKHPAMPAPYSSKLPDTRQPEVTWSIVTSTSTTTGGRDPLETQDRPKHHTAGRTSRTGSHDPGAYISKTSQIGYPHNSPSTKVLISKNTLSQHLIGGETLAPISPITVSREQGPVTIRLLTSRSRTLIALGTTTTLGVDGKGSSPPPLAFTRASDGDFVLSGTTLASGKPITIGEIGHQTTLRLTTVSSVPAVVVNGNTTELLGHDQSSTRLNASTSISLPVIITASAQASPSRTTSSVRSTTSGSGSVQLAGPPSLMIFLASLFRLLT